MLTIEAPSPRIWRPTIIQSEVTRLSLRKFTKEAWHTAEPAKMVWNWHLDALCDHLSYVSSGEIRFLMINMPPRTSKSLVTSVFYPVWDWLQDPTLQFLTASYALQLSARDALRSRRVIESPWFQERWGHRFRFSFDEKLKRQYSNDKGGRRIAIATESATTGEGGNRLIVDDPHNATDLESETKRKGTQEWWDHAMVNRLNQANEDAWIINGQRTGEDDLFGHLERTIDMKEVTRLILPNEYEAKRKCIVVLPGTKKVIFRDPRKTEGELLNPARVSAKATKRLKRTMKDKYTLQYQQNPKGSGGKILKREAWKVWEGKEMPECEYVISVYDTAYGEKQTNDYSARTDWGVFSHVEDLTSQKIVGGEIAEETARAKSRRCLILLGAWRGRIPYHELKRRAKLHYQKIKPDWTLIEKKGSGISLCQDLARANVRGLRRISVDHGGKVKLDKVERANIASVVLDDGLVFYPSDRQWAEMVIDECSAFPEGKNDDWVDTVLMAFQFLRRLGEVSLWEGEEDDGTVRLFKRSKKSLYG